MRKVCIITIMVLLGILIPQKAYAMDMLEDIDWSQLDETVEESGLPYDGFKEYLKAVLEGETGFSFRECFSYVMHNIFAELKESLQYILQMTALLIVAALMKTMNAGSIGMYAVMVVFIWTVVQSFQIPYEQLGILIHRVQTLGQAEIPVLAAISIASGHFTTATLQGEILLSVFNLLLHIIQILFMPVIQILFILYIIEALTGDEWSEGLASILHTLTSKGMKIFTTVMLVLVSLRVQVTGISDQWIRKAATSVASAIPVIGNSLSSALDTVTSSAGILLKTVGVLGLVLLLMVCIMPVCKMIILWLMYKLLMLMADPFIKGGPKKLIKALSECVSLMLGLMTCIMIAYGGVVVVFVMTIQNG